VTDATDDDLPRPWLLYVVKQVEQASRVHIDAIVKDEGLTAIQYAALSVLDHHGEMSGADLARHSFVRAQSMADLIGALDRLELLDRRPDPHDRRRSLLRLSARGQRIVADLKPQIAELEHRMLESLGGDADADALRRALVACRQALTEVPVRD
jgi:Transcriptional regulators